MQAFIAPPAVFVTLAMLALVLASPLHVAPTF